MALPQVGDGYQVGDGNRGETLNVGAGIQPVEASGNQVTLTAKWDTRKLYSMVEKIVVIGAAKANEVPKPAIGK